MGQPKTSPSNILLGHRVKYAQDGRTVHSHWLDRTHLRRQGVNLLGGRAIQKFMHPYMAAELGPRFKLTTPLRQGMLPVAWKADNPIPVLEAYNGLYLQEEVQMEGLVRNIGAFARFLQ